MEGDMEWQATPAGDDQTGTGEQPATALIVRAAPGALTRPRAWLARRRLPARVVAHLPALWQGGRGPLARAALAGGLLALGSFVGRRTALSSVALVPNQRRERAAAPLSTTLFTQRTTRIEMELVETTTRAPGGAMLHQMRHRVRLSRTSSTAE
jgi:hypothetical protein